MSYDHITVLDNKSRLIVGRILVRPSLTKPSSNIKLASGYRCVSFENFCTKGWQDRCCHMPRGYAVSSCFSSVIDRMIFERDERATLMNVHIVTFVDVGDIFNSPMDEARFSCS